MRKIAPEMFEAVDKDIESSQQIKRESLSYWKDALRRLKKNKPAMVSFGILVCLITFSLIGPIISKVVLNYTYRTQNLELQNMPPMVTNKRTIKVTRNKVFSYDRYKINTNKNGFVLTKVDIKGSGEFNLKIGDANRHQLQGDKKEYDFSITTLPNDGWDEILEKLNKESEELLRSDSDFRGIIFKKSGNKLIANTLGTTKFNTTFWFGSDEFGRDMFTRLWEGGRVSFLIAFISVFMTIIMGIVYGGISGYVGGKTDIIMMRVIEVLMSVPSMLYIILLLTVMDPGLLPIILVLAFTSWMGTARLIRGEVLRLKHSEYVMAAETLGAGPIRIISKHLLPNTMGPLIVNMTMMIPSMIFSEAFLSYIGLGVPVPFASWGVLINSGAKIFTQTPHQLFVPAIALSLAMLAFNILGDGLRDALDPKLRK